VKRKKNPRDGGIAFGAFGRHLHFYFVCCTIVHDSRLWHFLMVADYLSQPVE
jgi:hypothetical protein